jgi:hypothetical protein
MNNSNNAPRILRCTDCPCEVSYIDHKGYIYCTNHGKTRQSYTNCRKLTASEINQLKSGQPIKKY